MGLKLFVLYWIVKARNLLEWIRVVRKYYFKNWGFARADLALCLQYIFSSPFSISKRFLKKRREDDLYTFGETPLTTLEKICKRAGLTAQEHILDLGCGRGRTSLWFHFFINANVSAIDYLPLFIRRAARVARWFKLKQLSYVAHEMQTYDFSDASAVYLYGTCFEEPFLKKLTQQMASLKKGAKVITVSYPLCDYASVDQFELVDQFTAIFTWGEAEVFLQHKK